MLINEKYCHFEAGTLIKPILIAEPTPVVKPIPALEPNPVVNTTPSILIPIPNNFLEVNVIPIPIPKKIGIITPLQDTLALGLVQGARKGSLASLVTEKF